MHGKLDTTQSGLQAFHLHDHDPELERELRMFAGILIEAYLAKPERQGPSVDLDKERASPTLLNVKADSHLPTDNE